MMNQTPAPAERPIKKILCNGATMKKFEGLMVAAEGGFLGPEGATVVGTLERDYLDECSQALGRRFYSVRHLVAACDVLVIREELDPVVCANLIAIDEKYDGFIDALVERYEPT